MEMRISAKEACEKVLWVFEDLFREGQLKKALVLVKLESNWDAYLNIAWAVINLIEQHMASGFETDAPQRYDLSSQILCNIASKVDGEQALENFVEYIEHTLNDMQFVYTLMPIRVSLLKITVNRVEWLDRCFRLIRRHLLMVHPVPGSAGKSRNDPDWNCIASDFILNLTYVVKNVVDFYDPFLVESALGSENSLPESVAVGQREKLTVFLLQLLGKPFMYIDMREVDDETMPKRLADGIVAALTRLVGDIFKYFVYAEQRENEGHYSEILDDEYHAMVDIPIVAVANLYYLVLTQGVCVDRVPYVYDPVYVWLNSMYLATCLMILFDDYNHVVARKGMQLFKKVTSGFKDLSIPHQVLEVRVHKRFVLALAKIDSKTKEKDVKVLITECVNLYVSKLDTRGRYLVLYNTVLRVKKPAFIARFTAMLLPFVTEALKMSPVSPYFSGRRLFNLLSCYSQIGREDIVEAHDQIVATLKILCFLKRNDSENASDIKKHGKYFESTFFRPLDKALMKYRGDYEVRLKDLQHALVSAPRRKTKDLPKCMKKWVTNGDMVREVRERINLTEDALNGFHRVDCWLNKIMVGGAIDSHSYRATGKQRGRKTYAIS